MNHSPLAELILEEMLERDWSLSAVVRRMNIKDAKDYGVKYLAMQMFLSVDDAAIKLGDSLHANVAHAFGVTTEFIANLDKNEPPPLIAGAHRGTLP